MEIEKMQEKLDSKNTYMNYFKLEEVKQKEEQKQKSTTHVRNLTVRISLVPLRHGQARHKPKLLLDLQVWEQVV